MTKTNIKNTIIVDDNYEFAFMLNTVKTEIQTNWILGKMNKKTNTNLIKESLEKLTEYKYNSQEIANIQTITNILNSTSDKEWLIKKAMEVPIYFGNSSLAEFVHLLIIFKAAVEYDGLTRDDNDTLDLIKWKIDEKLSSPDFMKKLKSEYPNTESILESIKDFYPTINTTDTTNDVIVQKPKYFSWNMIITTTMSISVLTGTCLGLFFYLKKIK